MPHITAIMAAMSTRLPGNPGGGPIEPVPCTCVGNNGCIPECEGYNCCYCEGVPNDYESDYPWYGIYKHPLPDFQIISRSMTGPIVGKAVSCGCTKTAVPNPQDPAGCNTWSYSGCETSSGQIYGSAEPYCVNGGLLSPCAGRADVVCSSCGSPNGDPTNNVHTEQLFSGCAQAPCLFGCTVNCLPPKWSDDSPFTRSCCNHQFCGPDYYDDPWGNPTGDCEGECADQQLACYAGGFSPRSCGCGYQNGFYSANPCENQPTGSYSANIKATTRVYGNSSYLIKAEAVAERTNSFWPDYPLGCHGIFATETDSENELGFYTRDGDCNSFTWNSRRDRLSVTFTKGCGLGFEIRRNHGLRYNGSTYDPTVVASNFNGAGCVDEPPDNPDELPCWLEGKTLDDAFDCYPDYFGINDPDYEQDYDNDESTPVLSVLPFEGALSALQRHPTMIMKVSGGSLVYRGSGCPGCDHPVYGDGCNYGSFGSISTSPGNPFGLYDADVYQCAYPDIGFTDRPGGTTYFLYKGCFAPDVGTLGGITYELVAKVGFAFGGFAGCVYDGCQDTAYCGDDDDYSYPGPDTIDRINGCNAQGDWRKIRGREYRFGCVKGPILPLHSTSLLNFTIPVQHTDFADTPW